MDETYKKKYAADKIAFLGLLLIGLLAAFLIITSRSAIVLSEPITLSHTGLSVSIPAGNGWHSQKQWKHLENEFILSSVFDPGSGQPLFWAGCFYKLAEKKTSPQTRLEQKAAEIGGQILKIEQINTAVLDIDWAHIKKPDGLSSTFFATITLSDARQLDIEVTQITGETKLAEQAFNLIIASLQFEGNHLLEAGSEIITNIKNTGLNSLFSDKAKEVFFLLRDSKKHPIGFTIDTFADAGQQNQLSIQVANLLYLPGRLGQEQITSLHSQNNLSQFVIKNEISTLRGRTGTEITLDKAGLTTIRKFGPQSKEKTYQLSSAAIPDILSELIFTQMLNSNYDQILVDLLTGEGKIIPTLVSRIQSDDTVLNEKEIAHALKVELLDGRGFFEFVYFDSQGLITKTIVHQDDVYILDRSDAETILALFPEAAEYLLEKKQVLEHNRATIKM